MPSRIQLGDSLLVLYYLLHCLSPFSLKPDDAQELFQNYLDLL